jgi:hypothetical protein
MARTEREQIRCTVKENSRGQPFLFFEMLAAEHLPSFPRTYFGLGLREGTTYAEARELANLFDERVDNHFALIFEPGD